MPQALVLAASHDLLLLTCGVDHETSLEAIDLARKSNLLRAFVGVHPSEALKETDLSWLDGVLEKASGLGEVGLDPKYSAVGAWSAQTRAFHAQLSAAGRAGKPVQVHSRGAERECLEALESYQAKPVLFHWLQDGSVLRRVQDKGYFVSFGPSLVYSKKLQRMAAESNRGLVLTETDSPVSYQPLGGASGPSLIPTVLFKLAELWRVPFEEAREAVCQNAVAYLAPSEKG